MPYGTKRPIGPWTLMIKLQHEPRCPGCAEFLQPCVVEFRGGWAWCQPCVTMGLHREPWIPSVLEGESIRAATVTVNGLRFYVPGVGPGEVLTAYERAAGCDQRIQVTVVPRDTDGVYALTPSGEHLVSDLDLSGLAQVERDIKRMNGRSSRE